MAHDTQDRSLTDDDVATGSRRSRRGVLGAIVIVALVAGGIAAALRYQPLRQVGDLETSPDLGAVLVEEFEAQGAHVVVYSHGDHASYGLTLRNTGPVGVTVTGIETPPEEQRRMLQPVHASVVAADDALPANLGDSDPLRPFALAPGEQRRIAVLARFDNCEYYTERAIERVTAQGVRFRVAGLPRTVQVPLQRPLLVRSPTIQRCPDRTLDRSDHRRSDP